MRKELCQGEPAELSFSHHKLRTWDWRKKHLQHLAQILELPVEPNYREIIARLDCCFQPHKSRNVDGFMDGLPSGFADNSPFLPPQLLHPANHAYKAVCATHRPVVRTPLLVFNPPVNIQRFRDSFSDCYIILAQIYWEFCPMSCFIRFQPGCYRHCPVKNNIPQSILISTSQRKQQDFEPDLWFIITFPAKNMIKMYHLFLEKTEKP